MFIDSLLALVLFLGATWGPSRLDPEGRWGRADSPAHRQHDPEACPAADHLIVGFGGLFQRVALDHRTNPRQRAELHRVLGVFGGARGPSLNGPACADEL